MSAPRYYMHLSKCKGRTGQPQDSARPLFNHTGHTDNSSSFLYHNHSDITNSKKKIYIYTYIFLGGGILKVIVHGRVEILTNVVSVTEFLG